MAAAQQEPKLVAIVGPTASGKSDLALRIAKEFNGEIITADSRTIYKGMDIGTAKATPEERKKVHHWGLDLIEPGGTFSAYKFRKYAEGAISDISSRGKLPIIVGGAGLYMDAVLFDFGFVSQADYKERERLQELSIEELQEIIKQKDYKMPLNQRNRRHLIRIIERKGLSGQKGDLRKNVVLIGLLPSDNLIRKAINKRSYGYFVRGLIDETSSLIDKYGKEAIKNSGGIAYKTSLRVLQKEIDQQQAKKLIENSEWQYARRQRTWFRRNKFIQWFESPNDAFASVKKVLNK